ncbi:MAG: hypothetical protein QOG89_2186 [Thermomicrobiales bacterium]|nr:hypothetical protein [Thermomicrobiales bacterium]
MVGAAPLGDDVIVMLDAAADPWAAIAEPGNAPAGAWQAFDYGGSARYVRFFFRNPDRTPRLGSFAEVVISG